VLSATRDNLKTTDSALLTGILVMVVLYFAREVFIPLALAGLLAFFLAPAAIRLERWGMKRTPAALLIILLSLAGLGVLGWVVLGQIYNLAVEFPQYQQNITEKIGSLHLDSAGRLSRTVEMLTNVSKQLKSGGPTTAPILSVTSRQSMSVRSDRSPALANKTAQPVSVRIEESEEPMLAVAGRTITPLIHPLTTTFIVVIFLIFMLVGRDDLRDRGLRLAGSGRMHVTTTAIEDASRRVTRYLQMQLIVNLCYGTIAGVLLRLIGVPHALLWGVLTCLLRFVPYIGILMAAVGPLLLSAAASLNWSALIWTVVTFAVLEMMAANFIEPMVYGASTGISAIAILIAAVFWTLLWGLPGLLLSTPLTVCLIVLGRQVPRLRYLEVLFGEETGLPPSERFYQRMLASNTRDATALIEDALKTKSSRAEAYDGLLIPALTMIEDARHSEEMTAARADEILQGIEELTEDVTSRATADTAFESTPRKRVTMVPARDFADEVACQLALQVLTGTASVYVMSADYSVSDLQQSVDDLQPDVICVLGIPPRAIRHIRIRCHQIRTRFPHAVVVACVLSKESDLSNLRSRIPTEDAQHVACSLQLMKDYLRSLLYPTAIPVDSTPELAEETKVIKEASETRWEMQQVDVDGPEEGMFNRLATNLARSFDAPNCADHRDGRDKMLLGGTVWPAGTDDPH
jgi:predicted PurR-regulated permease PerM